MRLLLDTHILLWYVLDDPQLSVTARALGDGLTLLSVDSKLDQYGVKRLRKCIMHKTLHRFRT